MHRYISLLCLAILFALLLAGCGVNSVTSNNFESAVEFVATIALQSPCSKAVSDLRGKTIYAMNRESQEIDIYLDGTRVNSIGGMGFERGNFQRLSDIGVDTDGGLLALDSVQKLLKKFTAEGMFVSQFRFDVLTQPELFCVAPDGALFLYDAAPGEIICFSPFDAREIYRFGRFELDRPSNLDCNKDYLWTHNREKESTQVFTLLGQYDITFKGIGVLDKFGSFFGSYRGETHHGPLLPPLSQTVRGDIVTEVWNNEIYLQKLVYDRRPDETQ